LPRDLGQGAVVQENGTKSFVAPVQQFPAIWVSLILVRPF
jgi:hypothetical protein